MAPKKRISRIPSRVVDSDLVVTNGSTRTIGIQTDAEPPAQFAPLPTKRQKILEKIKQLNLAKKPQKSSLDKASSSSLSVLKQVNRYPNSFEPGPNEKACQVKESELAAVQRCSKSDFAIKMESLKNEVDRRRVESIMSDMNRLETLDNMINSDPPPRWSVASEMWLEVDQLEARIEAFSKE
ncbi:hypothetical protein KR032_003553, partial [Drosophila birchii]